MRRPREKGWVLLKRIARYLVHAPDFVIEYKFEQSAEQGTVLYTDSDWGSCRITRRSTSGGVLCIGGGICQCMQCEAWSRCVVSPEAEVYAIV